MQKLTLTIAVALLASWQIPASAQTPPSANDAVMATVNQFLEGFNKGDPKTMLSAGMDQMSVIDEFPPHEWHGAGAFARWFSDYEAYAKKNGMTEGFVTLGKPLHLDVTADRAYVVVPADYAFKVNGKPDSEMGSVLTITLQDASAGWRITGWAWASR